MYHTTPTMNRERERQRRIEKGNSVPACVGRGMRVCGRRRNPGVCVWQAQGTSLKSHQSMGWQKGQKARPLPQKRQREKVWSRVERENIQVQ